MRPPTSERTRPIGNLHHLPLGQAEPLADLVLVAPEGIEKANVLDVAGGKSPDPSSRGLPSASASILRWAWSTSGEALQHDRFPQRFLRYFGSSPVLKK